MLAECGRGEEPCRVPCPAQLVGDCEILDPAPPSRYRTHTGEFAVVLCEPPTRRVEATSAVIHNRPSRRAAIGLVRLVPARDRRCRATAGQQGTWWMKTYVRSVMFSGKTSARQVTLRGRLPFAQHLRRRARIRTPHTPRHDAGSSHSGMTNVSCFSPFHRALVLRCARGESRGTRVTSPRANASSGE